MQKRLLSYRHVTSSGEHCRFLYVAEASSIGLKPGRIPEKIDTDMGNGQPFFLARVDRDGEGDVHGWEYKQSLGSLELLIVND